MESCLTLARETLRTLTCVTGSRVGISLESQDLPRAFALRAPLAERSAVNRQVLGSIPSGGVFLS